MKRVTMGGHCGVSVYEKGHHVHGWTLRGECMKRVTMGGHCGVSVYEKGHHGWALWGECV